MGVYKKKDSGKSSKSISFRLIVILIIIGGIILILFLFPSLRKAVTGFATNTLALNITVGAPKIVYVWNETLSPVTINSGPANTGIIVNFTVYHRDAEQLNDSTAYINITSSGEDIRINNSCMRIASWGDYVNYSCNVTMWWWDAAGAWTLSAFIKDNSTNSHTNNSKSITLSETTSFTRWPTTITWGAIAAGQANQTSSNDPLTFNNTGNDPIGGAAADNISINSTDLTGEEVDNVGIWAENMSISTWTGGVTECNASTTPMRTSNFTNITGATLPKGNYTINDGTAQEQLYFCVKITGTELTQQAYSTAKNGSWTVQID